MNNFPATPEGDKTPMTDYSEARIWDRVLCAQGNISESENLKTAIEESLHHARSLETDLSKAKSAIAMRNESLSLVAGAEFKLSHDLSLAKKEAQELASEQGRVHDVLLTVDEVLHYDDNGVRGIDDQVKDLAGLYRQLQKNCIQAFDLAQDSEEKRASLERRISALEGDKNRLDWLEENGASVDLARGAGPFPWRVEQWVGTRKELARRNYFGPSPRDAIDAAISATSTPPPQ